MSDTKIKNAADDKSTIPQETHESLPVEKLDKIAGGVVPPRTLRNGDPCDGSE